MRARPSEWNERLRELLSASTHQRHAGGLPLDFLGVEEYYLDRKQLISGGETECGELRTKAEVDGEGGIMWKY